MLSLILLAHVALAQSANRLESLTHAQVWSRPSWIDANFKFSTVNLVNGPPKVGWETSLERETVTCSVTADDLAHGTHGMTNKFFCSVDDAHSSKFKYGFEHGEISAEVMGTRLMWALGFGADRMYLVGDLACTGCTPDPFKDRRIDPDSVATPRHFENVGSERKFAKHYIGRGWKFKELMDTATPQNLAERDALRLLSVFFQHADNKAENQDLACLGVDDANGGCSGPTFALLQDVGATFGSGQIDRHRMSKAVLDDWKKKPLWKDHDECTANLGMNAEAEMYYPKISEEGRAFLAQLLNGFSEGADGRKRVEDLFRAGHADWRGGSIQDWADTFYAKVKELNEPCAE